MELRHLKYFVAVAQERHFGNAARRLQMAQPPLSQQIRAFESQLGVTLFERTTRSVSLTTAGEVLLERTPVLLAEMEKLERDVRRVHAGVQGVLRIGSTGSAAYRVLPRVLREARRQTPELGLEIRGEILNPEIVENLAAHRLDAALLRLPVSSAGLAVEVIQSDELQVALPEDHAMAGQEEVDLAALHGEPLVSYPSDSAVAIITAELCRAAGFQPEVFQVVSETSTLVSLVAGGGCSAIVPEPVSALGTPGVVFRKLADRPCVDLAMAWRNEDDRPLLHALLDVIRTSTRAPGDSAPAQTQSGLGVASTAAELNMPTRKDDEDL